MPRQMSVFRQLSLEPAVALSPRFSSEVHVVCVHESKFKMNIGELLFDYADENYS